MRASLTGCGIMCTGIGCDVLGALDNLDAEFCIGHAYGEPWDPSDNGRCAWSHFCLKVGDAALYGCREQ
ncbi:MAG TPA: hypothetical protein VI796_00325 [Candidatus Thermoplasmatota archaeon]|nr:hypothetical protein [Candidatus Thermoplasmatota archaeon]